MRGAKFILAALALATVGAPANAQLFGPGKFKIESSNDRFSTNGITNYTGLNNRVSKKSPAGGIYINGEGVYVEPIASVRQSDGAVVSIGLMIHNETNYDTLLGKPNSLGTLRRLTIIIDGGAPTAFDINDAQTRTGDTAHYNTIMHSSSSTISERGFVTLTAGQFHRLAKASTIAMKIEGSDRSTTFDERDIGKAFIPNLRLFENSLATPKK